MSALRPLSTKHESDGVVMCRLLLRLHLEPARLLNSHRVFEAWQGCAVRRRGPQLRRLQVKRVHTQAPMHAAP
jgi:hypothetical protein